MGAFKSKLYYILHISKKKCIFLNLKKHNGTFYFKFSIFEEHIPGWNGLRGGNQILVVITEWPAQLALLQFRKG